VDRAFLEEIKPGILRRQVEKHFDKDGGLQFGNISRYYLRETHLRGRENAVVMINIEFKPVAMDEATFANPERRSLWLRKHGGWNESPNDVAKAVSAPYESGIHID
jgi:hypothetical protein